MDNFDDCESIELIIHVLTKIQGIGDKTAAAIAVYYGTLDNFLDANFASLGSIINFQGKRVVKPTQAQAICEAIQEVPKGYSVKETWIRLLIKEFLDKQASMLENLSLSSLMINPFLVKALNLKTPDEVIKFNLYQSVTRSIVTSWGMYVQSILQRSGARKITEKHSGFDIQKVYEDIVYYLQIKSSPNSMNVDMIRHFNTRVADLQKKGKKYKALLGLAFGNKDVVGHQITSYVDLPQSHVLVGKELWDFVSEETNFHCKVLNAIIEVVAEGSLPKNFSEMVEDKFEKLLDEWVNEYGEGQDSVDKVVSEGF